MFADYINYIKYLRRVAEENAALYEKGKYEFQARMFMNGWDTRQIEIMVEHLERKINIK